ncbi:MAG: hypothetical protein SOV61_10685 [Lachnospiraceae bacterium]|nr:hypothetical protein [Lachnospiraceae bacterium]
MGVMFTHALIAEDCKPYEYTKFIPNALHPFDALKVILEQRIYHNYLQGVVNDRESYILNDLNKTIENYYAGIPKKLHDKNETLNRLYDLGIRVYEKLTRGQELLTKHFFSNSTYYDLVAIFQTAPQKTYYNSLYTASLNHTFLTQWFTDISGGWYDQEVYPEGYMSECALFVPQISFVKGSETESCMPDDHVCIKLEPKTMRRFYFEDPNDFKFDHMKWQTDSGLALLLTKFDIRPYSIDDLIGMTASFAIDHSKYIMTNSGVPACSTISDICFDIVTGSSFVDPGLTGKNRVPHLEPWLESVAYLVRNDRLKTAQDNELFGELLRKLNTDPELVNFFTKPITQISATEAYAFRSSLFADFISDRLEIGMEALEDNQETDEPSEELSDSQEPEEEEKILPQIDPGKMLLEIANPSEPMSDYIYRKTVSHRISYLLKNPPENAMPNDLLMLKRWRSRWLYLASISCLRDFLTRVSLRLSM